ncbi:MAG: DNA adenine methylase [Gammaproteobacteria bacterium]
MSAAKAANLPPAPRTEGIKYAGSKLKLLPHILRLVKQTGAKTVFDGFCGTTRVSQALAKSGCHVFANDIAVWSEVFAECYLRAQQPPEYYRPLFAELNAAPPVDGWFTEHYGGEANGGCAAGADGLKKPWQKHNTRKLDGVRIAIEKLSLNKTDKAVALAGLMLALDKVDSTLGHFASYLREWPPRAYKPLALKPPQTFNCGGRHKIFCGDVFAALPKARADLAYYDPPYGSCNEKMPPSRVRYAAYYHIWKTVCLFDSPQTFGKAKRRADTSDTACASPFEEFRKDGGGRYIAARALEKLIGETRARWILLSYSSGGRATAEELREILKRAGRLREAVEIDYKMNVMAGMKWTDEWSRNAAKPNREFLFLIEK